MGANASGKTSLGRVMCAINNYLIGRSTEGVPLAICDKDKNASFEVIYVTPETRAINKLSALLNISGLVREEYAFLKLRKSKSLLDTLEEIDTIKPNFVYDINGEHSDIENPGFKSVAFSKGRKLCGDYYSWNYMFCTSSSSTNVGENTDVELLKKILNAFDSSIMDVKKIQESSKNAYVIKFSNGDDVITEDGKILDADRLSRGALESIEVASFVDFLMRNNDSTLFLDEKMAYSHSELELSMLNLMIEKLGKNSQLFYTSHNYDVLEMNLPSHSYVFMRKKDFVEVIHPEKLGYTKNDRNLLGFVKNDVFETLPDTAKIEELL
ncbi:MAG: hypothetical protein Rsou_0618 [Candidatus Ruthia sp. Asou_11_S2]|nr:hypothetical protein [Candidatus Ruthia sp. Asou_11_S2]